MSLKLTMRITAEEADEVEKAEELNAELQALGLLAGGHRRATRLDACLANDLNRILADLGQLLKRARARRGGRR